VTNELPWEDNLLERKMVVILALELRSNTAVTLPTLVEVRESDEVPSR
jgi:hypothetical protein